MISKSQLVLGAYYMCMRVALSRGVGTARWNGEVFVYWRTKFGSTFPDALPHPEDEEQFYGGIISGALFVPELLINKPEEVEEIPMEFT